MRVLTIAAEVILSYSHVESADKAGSSASADPGRCQRGLVALDWDFEPLSAPAWPGPLSAGTLLRRMLPQVFKRASLGAPVGSGSIRTFCSAGLSLGHHEGSGPIRASHQPDRRFWMHPARAPSLRAILHASKGATADLERSFLGGTGR